MPFTTEDLAVIEKKMHEVINKGNSFKREVWKRNEAINYFIITVIIHWLQK